MEDVPKLPDEHMEKAKEMISRHRTKKNCKRCYDRGYQGINQLNMVITCHKCVDEDKVTQEWQAYVRDTPALAEVYGDYFESEEEEEGTGEEKPEPTPEAVRRVAATDRGRDHKGAQRHRSVGR
jgi:superfamily II DNA helicase RecQ